MLPTSARKTKKIVKKKEKLPKLEDNTDPSQEQTTEEILFTKDFQLMGELESTDAANKKAGGKKTKKIKKAKKKTKEPLDSISRFFRDYGKNPHLQTIEMTYLRYLQTFHAPERHL